MAGWQQKYIIAKTNGRPVDPKAVYFVLRLDTDPNARVAVLAYAASVEENGNQELAQAIRKRVSLIHALGRDVNHDG